MRVVHALGSATWSSAIFGLWKVKFSKIIKDMPLHPHCMQSAFTSVKGFCKAEISLLTSLKSHRRYCRVLDYAEMAVFTSTNLTQYVQKMSTGRTHTSTFRLADVCALCAKLRPHSLVTKSHYSLDIHWTLTLLFLVNCAITARLLPQVTGLSNKYMTQCLMRFRHLMQLTCRD